MSDKLSLELPSKTGREPNLIEIEVGMNVQGTVTTSNGVKLEHIAADTLDASRLRWSFGAATMELGPVALEALEVDLDIPSDGPLRGSIKVANIKATGRELNLGGGRVLRADGFEGRHIAISFTDEGVRFAAQSLDLLGVHGRLDYVLPQNKPKTYEDYQRDADVAAKNANVNGVSGDMPFGPKLDWRFLDALDGRIVLKFAIELALPIVGEIEHSMAFEIPIGAGVIDFKALEQQLGTIADTIIDFEVEEGRLILEKDIPLGGNETLVYWPLGSSEQTLAQDHKIRLSTLMSGLVPAKTPKELKHIADEKQHKADEARQERADGNEPEKASVRLKGIDIERLDIDLSFGPATPERKGAVDATGRISVAGGLHHRAEGAPVEHEDGPSELRLSVDGLRLATSGLAVAAGKGVEGSLQLDVAELVVGVVGNAPQSLVVRTDKVSLGGTNILLRG